MNGTKALAMVIIATFISIGISVGAEMTGDELASMEKVNALFKSKNGIVCPGLRLTEKDMAQWRDLKFDRILGHTRLFPGYEGDQPRLWRRSYLRCKFLRRQYRLALQAESDCLLRR